MKKLLLTLMVLMAAQLQAQTKKCDWSNYWMKKVNQQQNAFTFQTNLHNDPCIDYNWIVYDYQLKRNDTIPDTRGYAQVQFNAKGKYKVALKAVDRCNKCDTLFYQIIDITIYGKKAKFSYTPSIKDCKAVTFEMANIDTCINYYYEIWNANEYTKNMTDKQWKEYSDSLLYFTFEWEEKNLIHYSKKSERVLKHEFTDSGRYLIYTYWQNKCSGIDTFAFNKIIVCPKEVMSNIVKLNKNEPKLIGVYDMMGRPVYYIRRNEIMIYRYDDGTTKKVISE
jgi:hypothetical protein